MEMVLLAASDCPSDWGWNAELRCNLVPVAAKSAVQNAEGNTVSRSETMDVGTPWRRTMSVKNARTTVSAVYGCARAMKWAYLEILSTTVSMTVLPATRGKPSTKSMAISDHTAAGTGSGSSNPAGCKCSVLLRWQTRQPRTKSLTRRRS
uniref:Uncharacterized protein n=1 Tax=Oryza glaberrima TaxID=4538 RepID=I1QNX0_ORYGL